MGTKRGHAWVVISKLLFNWFNFISYALELMVACVPIIPMDFFLVVWMACWMQGSITLIIGTVIYFSKVSK